MCDANARDILSRTARVDRTRRAAEYDAPVARDRTTDGRRHFFIQNALETRLAAGYELTMNDGNQLHANRNKLALLQPVDDALE